MALTDQLIDAIIEKGEGDFSNDLSTPLANIFTMKFLGLPLEDWSHYAWFIQSANGGSSSVQPRTKKPSERELHERVAAEVVRQRTQPIAGGAIAHLLDATVDGRKLDSWEIEAYIWLLIGKAVDFDRANKRHMTFGLGPHRCIGADVVRLEFRIMFEQILSRMPDFRVEEAELRPSPAPAVVAGYEHVPFVFMPGKKVGGPRIAY